VLGDICSPYEYIVALAFVFYEHDPEAVAGGGFVGGPAVAAGGAPEVGVAAEPATEAAMAPWAPFMDGDHGPDLGALYITGTISATPD
jgi:hypothetical protein